MIINDGLDLRDNTTNYLLRCSENQIALSCYSRGTKDENNPYSLGLESRFHEKFNLNYFYKKGFLADLDTSENKYGGLIAHHTDKNGIWKKQEDFDIREGDYIPLMTFEKNLSEKEKAYLIRNVVKSFINTSLNPDLMEEKNSFCIINELNRSYRICYANDTEREIDAVETIDKILEGINLDRKHLEAKYGKKENQPTCSQPGEN